MSNKDHVGTEEVRRKIQDAAGVHGDLLTKVKKQKLRRYDHISRSSGTGRRFCNEQWKKQDE